MSNSDFVWLDLQRFADGGAGGDGGAAGGADGGAGAEAGTGTAEAAAKGRGKGGSLADVQYGIQEAPEADAPKEAAKAEPAPKKISFDEALKTNPEYAREMQRRIDQAINKRFAKTKAAEEQTAKLMPAINMLAERYGVKAGDLDGFIEAVMGDTDLIEQQAMDAGMEPDAYREFQRLKAENEALKQAEQDREQRQHVEQQMAQWQQQAERAKLIFPTLDLQVEARNPQFAQMLGAGIDVMTAFRVVHQDEIESGLIQKAAAEATQKTVASIAAKSNRPRENGAAKTKPANVRADIQKLTRQDFDEILRRASRGENIRF